MEKNNASCRWGDCPNLDYGPKSTEHDGRFTKRNIVESQMIKSDSAIMIKGDNTHKQVK